METTKRTELIEAIIKQSFPFGTVIESFKYKLYNYEEVFKLCNLVWDTANNELDEICELKADKEVLEQRIDGLEDVILSNDKQIQKQLSEIESLRDTIETHEEYLLQVEENKNLYETKIVKLEQENKELTYEIESNKTHLQDTYEEMQRTNQAEYERGLQEGYDDHLNDSNNEH